MIKVLPPPLDGINVFFLLPGYLFLKGMNLVPIDVSLEEKVIFFYHRSNFLRAVKLRDLYLDKSQLKQTASHLAWGSIAGFNHANQLVVELVTGSKVAFSAKSGLPEKLAER